MTKDNAVPRQLSKRMQMARFVVYVDQQAKSSFETRDAADAEAARILKAFPILAVRVADAEDDSIKALGPTKAKDEPEDAADAGQEQGA